MKLLLMSPPSRLSNHYRPPLSLMYVANYYKDQGYEVDILDYQGAIVRNTKYNREMEKNVKKIKDKIMIDIINSKPDIVGISCYSTEYEEVMEFIKEVVKVSDAKIMVGGIHPTLRPEDFQGKVDECMVGRFDNGNPTYEGIDLEYYTNANPYAVRGVFIRPAYILTSFGCPARCTFCVATGLMKTYKKVHFRKPQEIFDEMVTISLKKNPEWFIYLWKKSFLIQKYINYNLWSRAWEYPWATPLR